MYTAFVMSDSVWEGQGWYEKSCVECSTLTQIRYIWDTENIEPNGLIIGHHSLCLWGRTLTQKQTEQNVSSMLAREKVKG